MKPEHKQLVIIGAGPAGMAAALAASKAGIRDLVILEQEERAGGILNQCIHNGFGLHTFHEELTGPEYAARYEEQVSKEGIEIRLNTTVIDLSDQRLITCLSPQSGLQQIQADGVILAMGCRERPRGALQIPGYRPAGIYSAGTAQKLVNLEHLMPGKDVVILGSGDIGLIMARRMCLEGARVHAVVELMPYSGGLQRNIVQCLEDFEIPLLLSHTITRIEGRERLEAVTIARVDENRRPVPGTEQRIACDTLLLSCGLLPENELSRQAGIMLSSATRGPVVDESLQTSVPGIFAAGNVLHVHDLVDFVSQEAAAAGTMAARQILESEAGCKAVPDAENETDSAEEKMKSVEIHPAGAIRYTVPSVIHPGLLDQTLTIRFRTGCVLKNARIQVLVDGKEVFSMRKSTMVPAQMETITLKKAWLENAGQAVVIKAEEMPAVREAADDKKGENA